MTNLGFSLVLAGAVLATWSAEACVPIIKVPAQIFFDFEKDILSPRARQSAATSFPTVKGQDERCGSFSVVGHLDSAEAESQSDLDLRRADAVGAVLLEAGFRKATIKTSGVGHSRPMVLTSPGAREVQNRRVEIMWLPVQGACVCEEYTGHPPPMCDVRVCHVILSDGLKCRVQ